MKRGLAAFPIVQGDGLWAAKINDAMNEIDLRLAILENQQRALLEAIAGEFDALQKYAPKTAEAAALMAINYMDDGNGR